MPSQDTCSEIRRKVHRSRLDRGILSGAGGPVVALDRELELVADFLLQEFGELTVAGYRASIDVEALPDVKSWDYPGRWTTPLFEELAGHFVRGPRGFLFSTSGSFTLTLHKYSLSE